jgi:hypothetical protein
MAEDIGKCTPGDAESALQYLHRDVPRGKRSSLQVHEDTAEAIELLKNRLNAGAGLNVATADDAIRLALLVLSRYHRYEGADVTEREILDGLEELTMGISETTDLHGELIGMSDGYKRNVRDPTPWIPDEVPRRDVEAVIDAYFDNPHKYKEWPGFQRRTNDAGR